MNDIILLFQGLQLNQIALMIIGIIIFIAGGFFILDKTSNKKQNTSKYNDGTGIKEQNTISDYKNNDENQDSEM